LLSRKRKSGLERALLPSLQCRVSYATFGRKSLHGNVKAESEKSSRPLRG
jgi:hypothetical protein